MHHLLSLDMFQTAGVGVIALVLGMFFTRTVPFLKRFCIPAPVSGGILISLLTLASYSFLGVEFSFDGTIKDICMMLFFTSVGFQSNMKALKQGGRALVVMIILVAGESEVVHCTKCQGKEVRACVPEIPGVAGDGSVEPEVLAIPEGEPMSGSTECPAVGNGEIRDYGLCNLVKGFEPLVAQTSYELPFIRRIVFCRCKSSQAIVQYEERVSDLVGQVELKRPNQLYPL